MSRKTPAAAVMVDFRYELDTEGRKEFIAILEREGYLDAIKQKAIEEGQDSSWDANKKRYRAKCKEAESFQQEIERLKQENSTLLGEMERLKQREGPAQQPAPRRRKRKDKGRPRKPYKLERDTRLRQLFQEGKSPEEVQVILSREGYRKKNGKPLSLSAIDRARYPRAKSARAKS